MLYNDHKHRCVLVNVFLDTGSPRLSWISAVKHVVVIVKWNNLHMLCNLKLSRLICSSIYHCISHVCAYITIRNC